MRPGKGGREDDPEPEYPAESRKGVRLATRRPAHSTRLCACVAALKKETAMTTPHISSTRRALRALCATGLALAAIAAAAGDAGAHVTPAQAAHAAGRGANWFQATQEESGRLDADWAM